MAVGQGGHPSGHSALEPGLQGSAPGCSPPFGLPAIKPTITLQSLVEPPLQTRLSVQPQFHPSVIEAEF